MVLIMVVDAGGACVHSGSRDGDLDTAGVQAGKAGLGEDIRAGAERALVSSRGKGGNNGYFRVGCVLVKALQVPREGRGDSGPWWTLWNWGFISAPSSVRASRVQC